MGEITCIFLRPTRNATYGKTQSISNKYCFGLLDHRRCYLSNTSFSFSFIEKETFFSQYILMAMSSLFLLPFYLLNFDLLVGGDMYPW